MFTRSHLKKTIISLYLGLTATSYASNNSLDELANQLENRWQKNGNAITWQVNDQHQDHIEMSGEQISTIIYYGNDEHGNLTLNRKLVWPMLRTIPNDTHASLIHEFPLDVAPVIKIDGKIVTKEKLSKASIDGTLNLTTSIGDGIVLTRTLSPSTTEPAMIERYRLHNTSDSEKHVEFLPNIYSVKTDKEQGVYGSYTISAQSQSTGSTKLAPNAQIDFFFTFFAVKQGQKVQLNGEQEIANRQAFVQSLQQDLQLETPDPVLNQMFDFAKLRGTESIFRTKGGLMHGPGGGRYYAAIWANDQAEYINPFFPFLGNDNGNESAINSFEHFARYMNDKFEPIPSSIIAEGIDYWNGAGDRGDCAMIAYGASRFALAYGDEKQATELLPLIDWCLEFSLNKLSDQGVIASDSDELEGRFPAGDYNLSTNMLAYGGLISSAHLNRELGRDAIATKYQKQAKTLLNNIDNYFAANVQGFDTYRYYEGNDKLRAWIALPFSMGVFKHKQGTLDALLSPHLWNENGIYTEAGNKTFWDRATLYAFRGIFAAQETDTAMRYFKYYSRKRLLGEHVPYAVEAWPEGNQRHLSAESALYARVVTEGIFGIEPTGFNQFDVAPYLPSSWNKMCLNKIRAFNNRFDICVQRNEDKSSFTILVTDENGEQSRFPWRGDKPMSITL